VEKRLDPAVVRTIFDFLPPSADFSVDKEIEAYAKALLRTSLARYESWPSRLVRLTLPGTPRRNTSRHPRTPSKPIIPGVSVRSARVSGLLE